MVLGYTRGHFSALVAMESDNSNELGAGANVDSVDSVHITYLPLVDYEGKLLPVHFLSAEEVRLCLDIGLLLMLEQQAQEIKKRVRVQGRKSRGMASANIH